MTTSLPGGLDITNVRNAVTDSIATSKENASPPRRLVEQLGLTTGEYYNGFRTQFKSTFQRDPASSPKDNSQRAGPSSVERNEVHTHVDAALRQRLLTP